MPLVRRLAAPLAVAVALAGCGTDPDTPRTDPDALAAVYVAAFEEAGKVIDTVDASGSWELVRGADDFNTFAHWDADPYTMRSFDEDDMPGVVTFCVLDTSHDVYAAAAAAPADDGSGLTYAIGFGPGTGCHTGPDAQVSLAVDSGGVIPLAGDDPALTRAVLAEFDAVRDADADADAGTSAEAVVLHAAWDLAADAADWAAAGTDLEHVDADVAADRGEHLPRGTRVQDWSYTGESLSFCILHLGAGAWARYTAAAPGAADATVTLGRPGDPLCG